MSNKHRHCDKIVAKAENMDLAVLAKSICDKVTGKPVKWAELWKSNEMSWLVDDSRELFLCLPQHKEACLHWLNGGVVQYLSNGMGEWIDFGISTAWGFTHLFMTNECEIRIKPKKEKRWIAVNSDGYVMPVHCGNIESARQHASHIDSRLTENVQFIEIEVEVNQERD